MLLVLLFPLFCCYCKLGFFFFHYFLLFFVGFCIIFSAILCVFVGVRVGPASYYLFKSISSNPPHLRQHNNTTTTNNNNNNNNRLNYNTGQLDDLDQPYYDRDPRNIAPQVCHLPLPLISLQSLSSFFSFSFFFFFHFLFLFSLHIIHHILFHLS